MNEGKKTYICKECGEEMEVVEDEVICMKCGYSVYIEDYGFDDDDTYYGTYFEAEAYRGECDNFPEEFPPVYDSEDDEE